MNEVIFSEAMNTEHWLGPGLGAQIIVFTGAEPDRVGEGKIITACLNIDIQTHQPLLSSCTDILE